MESPITGKEMSLLTEKRTLNFRKEEFEVTYHYYLCEDTQEQFTDALIDEVNLRQVHNQYRDIHNLPFPEEIKKIREKYELSASKMSEVLGFGVNSYRNYENGEVPSQSNGNLIQLMNDPEKFCDLITFSSVLAKEQKLELLKRVGKLAARQSRFDIDIENYLIGNDMPNEFNGYKRPSLEKFTEMVVYFAEKLEPWKTKLNKLLFYSDFLMFRQHCFSISGVQYKAITRGPVPNNFQSLFEYMMNKDDVDIWYKRFPDGKEGEQFKQHPGREFNATLFSKEELEVLETVAERFKEVKTQEIIEISHREEAWKLNETNRETINYKYAFELKEI